MTEVIRYEHVDISYKGKRVVHDVSFSVEKGEILGIVGESGSGKSTLIKAAMGLLGKDGLVTRGDIWYKGMDLPDLKPREMRKLCGTGAWNDLSDGRKLFLSNPYGTGTAL